MYKNQIFHDKEEFMTEYRKRCVSELSREFEKCTDIERYNVLVKLLMTNIRQIQFNTENGEGSEDKKIIYFSMEFLIGKLLRNYLINLGVEEVVERGLEAMGESLDHLCSIERDPGLGNGGLGRLAACFMDSLASLGYHGYGNGIRYRYGLFKQKIVDGRQVELADDWMAKGYPWERKKFENAVVVKFNGRVVRHEENGEFWYSWEDADEILAVPYDVPILGYGGKNATHLRLWSAEPLHEDFDMGAFNKGDYSGALKFKSDIEAISTLLYPDDTDGTGKLLRIKQEYMFVAAGLANIIKYYKKDYGQDWAHFADHICIHTNDTHPALCAPELLRILIDEEGCDWDTAWNAVTKSISYTNHTVLPEAMETWPIDLIEKLLPRVYNFIEEIDRRYREEFPHDRDDWPELLAETAILWDGKVRMANLSIIAGHSVNGVAALHTEILKRDTLKSFYELTPEKFNNKTNGISHRRFLLEANPTLSKLISDSIGPDWIKDPAKLSELKKLEKDAAFVKEFAAAKRKNKERLAAFIKEQSGAELDPNSIFDIQVKRFHAYKRQLLNLFKVIWLYNKIKEDPSFSCEPTSFIFAGKAAQGYVFAKEVIRFVNAVADVVNNDPATKGLIKVAFVENFGVSNAQLIYPAADISEQISTAGLEASGTGNMKFMMNGAITLGTLDGANVEIAEKVGEHIKIFGCKAEEIESLKCGHSYLAINEMSNNGELARIVDSLKDGTFARQSGDFTGIYNELIHKNDEFFVLKDFGAYVNAFMELTGMYKDTDKWNLSAIHNTASSGYFSSDRTIKEYVDDIWKL
ncbi:MAG: glycogen/starch/alpha-glucan phosphorylase [Parasporobacterium sp.]|nr:glycogen/starch/alpha-glucan phosphorylase [Parasporobacterium sp.]